MKRLAVLAAVLFLAAAQPSRAQQGGAMGGTDMDKQGGAAKGKAAAQPAPKAAAQGKTHKGSGTVTKVNPAAGRVTIAHGAIETLKWPAMTMTFGVSDKALLDHVHQGGKVDFEFVQKGPDYVINKIH